MQLSSGIGSARTKKRNARRRRVKDTKQEGRNAVTEASESDSSDSSDSSESEDEDESTEPAKKRLQTVAIATDEEEESVGPMSETAVTEEDTVPNDTVTAEKKVKNVNRDYGAKRATSSSSLSATEEPGNTQNERQEPLLKMPSSSAISTTATVEHSPAALITPDLLPVNGTHSALELSELPSDKETQKYGDAVQEEEEDVFAPVPWTDTRIHGRLVLGQIECNSPGQMRVPLPPYPYVNQFNQAVEEDRLSHRLLDLAKIEKLKKKALAARRVGNAQKQLARTSAFLFRDAALDELRRGDVVEYSKLVLGLHGPVTQNRIYLVHDNCYEEEQDGDSGEKDQSAASSSLRPKTLTLQVARPFADEDAMNLNSGFFVTDQPPEKNDFGIKELTYEAVGVDSMLLIKRNHVVFPSSWFEVK